MQKKVNTHKQQFDLKTHIRDGKGRIAKENHYRLTIENGVQKFERPPGSKIFYDAAGNLISKPAVAKQVEPKVDVEAKIAELEKADETVHMTVNDVTVDDVPVSAKVDLTEELALMEKAGASAQASEVKQKLNQKPFEKFVR